MVAGLIIKSRNPDKSENPEENQQDKSENHGQKLIDAIQSGNAKVVEDCIKAIAKAADREPHKEGPHIEPHSYSAQKED